MIPHEGLPGNPLPAIAAGSDPPAAPPEAIGSVVHCSPIRGILWARRAHDCQGNAARGGVRVRVAVARGRGEGRDPSVRVQFPVAPGRMRRIVLGVAIGLLAVLALDTGSRLARRAAAPDIHAPATAMQDSLAGARDLLKKRDHAGAQARALELLAQAEKSPGPGSLETAEVLDFLVEVARTGGAFAAPEALAYAERAVQIKERLLPADDLRIADQSDPACRPPPAGR